MGERGCVLWKFCLEDRGLAFRRACGRPEHAPLSVKAIYWAATLEVCLGGRSLPTWEEVKMEALMGMEIQDKN